MSFTVSLAIITFNSQLYIEETLESVLNLDEFPDELLIIDNASTDETVSIVNEFLPKLSTFIRQVKLITLKENTFASGGLTLALKESEFKYLAILHGDDCLNAEYFHSIRSFFKNSPEIDILNVSLKEFGVVTSTPKVLKPLWTPFDFLNRLLVNGLNPGTMPGAVIRRDFFDFDLPFTDLPAVNGVEDTIMWSSAVRHGAKVRGLRTPVVAYRRHEAQSSSSHQMAFFSGISRRYLIVSSPNLISKLLSLSEVEYEKRVYWNNQSEYQDGLENLSVPLCVSWFRIVNILLRRISRIINSIDELLGNPSRSD